MIQIKEIRVEDTYPIRKAVLRKNMTLTHEMPGDHDSDSVHLGVFDQNKLVCAGSFMKNNRDEFTGHQYQLRGMATAEHSQGKGYGQILLNEAEKYFKAREIDLIWCNARVSALEFYKKSGYKAVGEVFDVPQVGPHFVMFKKLARTSL